MKKRASRTVSVASGIALGVVLAGAPPPVLAQEQELTPEAKLARASAQEVPLMLLIREEQLGQVRALAAPTALAGAHAGDLAVLLDGRIDADRVNALRGLGDRMVEADVLSDIGVPLRLELATLSVALDLPEDQLPASKISAGSRSQRNPANVPDNANFAMGADISTRYREIFDGDTNDNRSVDLSVEGFANVGGRDGVYVMYGANLDYTSNDGADNIEVRRNRTYMFYDDRVNILRYSVGELIPRLSNRASSPSILGASISREYNTLDPGRSIQQAGSRSIILDKRADLEVYVNGGLVSVVTAGPGKVDLSDIPLIDTANNIEIVMVDDDERLVIDTFGFVASDALLETGVLEFSATAGMIEGGSGGKTTYTDDVAATAFARYGVMPNLTLSGSIQLTKDYQFSGLTSAFALGGVVFEVDGGVSRSQGGNLGFFAGLDFDIDEPLKNWLENSAFSASVSYVDRGFRTLGQTGDSSGEIQASTQLSFSVTDSVSTTLGLSASSDADLGNRRLQPSLGVSVRSGRVSVGASASYQISDNASNRDKFVALVNMSYDLAPRVSVGASTRSSNWQTSVYARRFAYDVVGDYGYEFRSETDEGGDIRIDARGRYVADRAVFGADIDQIFADGANRTSIGVEMQTGFAIADDLVAIGRNPGRGFTLVQKSPSLKDAKISIVQGGDQAKVRIGNRFGPAIMPQGLGYGENRVTVAAEDVPDGYNIGALSFRTMPGAATGDVVTVGSEQYRSVMGRLHDRGKPVALIASRIDVVEGEPLDPNSTMFFTNSEGRFFMGNLGVGRYRVSLPRNRGSFEIAIYDDSPVLSDIGTVEVQR